MFTTGVITRNTDRGFIPITLSMCSITNKNRNNDAT